MKFKEAITGMIPCMTDVNIRERYEIAVVDGRTGTHKLGKMQGDKFIWMGLPFSEFDEKTVYSWTHSERTMLIIL